jgi:branched-chain amino acid transport system substrate-binding protein
MRTKRTMSAGMALLGLAAAACLSSPSASGAATTSKSTGSSTCSGTPATGTPLKFGSIISVTGPEPYLDVEQGLQAAVKCVNARGGLGGRPMSITVCDDQGVPADADACAKGFSGDIAVVGGISLGFSQSTFNILESEGIPVIGQQPVATADYVAKNSFPLFGGVDAQGAGLGRFLAQSKSKSVAAMTLSIPGGEAATQVLCASFKAWGSDAKCSPVPVDPTATSLGPNVTAATAGGTPGVIVGFLAQPQCPALQLAIANAGVKSPQYYTGSCLSSQLINEAGSAAEGSRYTSEVESPLVPANLSNPGVALFLNAMKKYAPSTDHETPVQVGFAAPFFIQSAVKAIGVSKFNSATLTKWIKSAKNQPVLGAPAAYTFGSQGSTTPQLGQSTIQIVERKGSSYINFGKPVDGLTR